MPGSAGFRISRQICVAVRDNPRQAFQIIGDAPLPANPRFTQSALYMVKSDFSQVRYFATVPTVTCIYPVLRFMIITISSLDMIT